MLVLGIILGSLCLILVNTIAFNSLIDDLDELKKPIRVLLFIPTYILICKGLVRALLDKNSDNGRPIYVEVERSE